MSTSRKSIPHQFAWMGYMYLKLISLSEYSELSEEMRAEKLLDMYEEWESAPNKPYRERFSGTRQERLKKMTKVIWYFEHEGQRSE